jgi:hypothetical protein
MLGEGQLKSFDDCGCGGRNGLWDDKHRVAVSGTVSLSRASVPDIKPAALLRLRFINSKSSHHDDPGKSILLSHNIIHISSLIFTFLPASHHGIPPSSCQHN